MQLAGKVVLVTGAGQGLGQAIAAACVAAGARVGVNDLDPATAAGTAATLGESGLALPGDVGDEAVPASLVRAAIERWGRLDGLVCNAGILDYHPFLDLEPATWERVMRVNLTSLYLCCRAAIPPMLAQGDGRIVTISSVAGKRGGGLVGTAAYASAKAGVLGLTRALAREFGGRGIRVNAIAPGPAETAMTAWLDEERRRRVLAGIPMGRLGQPAEVAAAAVFLLSDAASYINGETLTVDGGLMTD
jgi:NAD(P)-dependent dehydrogenase (short-subunit alcohol dehydrogenase family)